MRSASAQNGKTLHDNSRSGTDYGLIIILLALTILATSFSSDMNAVMNTCEAERASRHIAPLEKDAKVDAKNHEGKNVM